MLAAEEYDYPMRRLVSAPVVAFAFVAVWLFAASLATAQMNNAPATGSSIGSGGHAGQVEQMPTFGHPSAPQAANVHPLSGAAVSPVSPGRLPQAPGSIVPSFVPAHPFTGVATPPSAPDRHHRHNGDGYPGVVYYPGYILDPGFYSPADQGEPAMNDSAAGNQDNAAAPTEAGPTIFDRRAPGQSSQALEAAYARQRALEEQRQPSAQSESPAPQSQPAPLQDQPQTVLMFKDGRQLEVQNYAIIGSMLYDMTPGRRSRIALSDLDLEATARENDARGVDFQLPAGARAN